MITPTYTVEHLATFGYGPNFGRYLPYIYKNLLLFAFFIYYSQNLMLGLNSILDGVRKLKQMELTNAIWAQRMVLRLKKEAIVVEDENMVP